MTTNVAQTMNPQKFYKMDEVLAKIHAEGLTSVTAETVEYHLHRTRKMSKPAKYVNRERYWTSDQIDSFIAEL